MDTSLRLDVEHVAPGILRVRTLIANAYVVSESGADDNGPWVLIDTGMVGFASSLLAIGAKAFGAPAPSAILLTHGHFDHVGSLKALQRKRPVPVYAHVLEFPYLTGRSAYPSPDPTVGGGLMSLLSVVFPRGPIDVGAELLALPEDGGVPALPGWKWYHTPGHAPGHVSFFREHDRVLVAGDALTTVRQESALAVLTQEMELRPPPAYFTIDWGQTVKSIRRLESLLPETLATGHGQTMRGEEMRAELAALSARPKAIVPAQGRYIRHPARPSAEPATSPRALGASSARRTGWMIGGTLAVLAFTAWRLQQRARRV